MAFPDTPLDTRMEILVNNAWTVITPDVYARDGISIRRGSSNESSQVEPSTASLTLDNRTGVYSPRNPTGAYYGQIGRNTRARISVPNASGTYLDLQGGIADGATAPDAAALGITGDIDIRVDVTLDSWRDDQGFAGKYVTTGNQRSWGFAMNTAGIPSLYWSPDGTLGARIQAEATLPLPVPGTGRRAVRVTLDVNNGAAGNTATFYYADTIAGSWTQLGDSVVTAGTTSIFDSTASVEVGLVAGLGVGLITGRVHAFQLLTGIAGTIVANPDFTIQDAGDTSFADTASAPNTWTVAGNAVLDDRDYRINGVIPSWPSRWDTSGTDVYVPVEISGILRRIGRGQTPLRSTMYRALITLADAPPIAYWPCEDESAATQIASALPSGKPLAVVGTPSFAASDVFACSAPLPQLADSKWSGPVPAYAATGEGQVRFLMSIPEGGLGTDATILRFFTTGSGVRRFDLLYTTGSTGSLTLKIYDGLGVELDTTTAGTGYDGVTMRVGVGYREQAGAVDFEYRTMPVDTLVEFTNADSLASSTAGNITSIVVDSTETAGDAVIGHISVHDDITSLAFLREELQAYVGEVAGRRVERLCAEEEITFRRRGDLDDSHAMGVQGRETLVDILRGCAEADDGVLYEPRHVFGLGYRPRTSQYNQEYAVTLDYASNELAETLEPEDDDQQTRNDVTASRTGGSSARVTQETGTLSILDPPDGVGVYDEQITVNIEKDSQLLQRASWHLGLGTVDEPRYPLISVNLANARIAADTTLVTGASACDIADRITVTNPPSWLPPDAIDQRVLGVTEQLGNYERLLSFNCAPAAPYTVAVAGDGELGRADTAGSELAASVTNSDTVLSVTTTTGPVWIMKPEQFPFDVRLGGEVVTVSLITGLVHDVFSRSTPTGWGTATSGHAWSTTGGSASDYSVQGV